jgi:Transcriptional regulators
MTRTKFTNEQVTEAVLASHSFAEVTRVLGMGRSGSASTHMRRRIEALGLDTSHFTGQGWAAGALARNRKAADVILVDHSNHPIRTYGSRLTRALLEIGRPYRCEGCGNEGEWQGQKLRLQVDHRNGNPYDDQRENLRFLCPNCHDQTPTHGKQKKVAVLE